MTEGDVDAGNFFILQNMTDNMGASGVGADGELADPVAVFISAGVCAKLVAQILVLGMQRADSIIFHFDCERIRFEVAKAFALIIAHHAIHYKDAVGIHWRGKDLAPGQVAPFVACDDSAGLEPSEFW
jgi:hypothetical protein